MPDTTPNYGWRIPKSDGTDYIVPDDVRLPVTSIDAQMKTEENARIAMGVNPWQNYVPILTAVTTNPNLGSTGSITGRYRLENKRCKAWVRFIFGGTGISLGSGIYSVSLPVAIGTNQVGNQIGTGRYRTNAGAYVMFLPDGSAGGTTFSLLVQIPAGTVNLNRLSNTFTGLGTGDAFEMELDYEVN